MDPTTHTPPVERSPVIGGQMIERVVHVRDKVDGAVYIGRRNLSYNLPHSPFANPYYISAVGRATAIEKYRQRLERSPRLLAMLPNLRGKPLACWCRHESEPKTEENACHGDVLREMLDTYTDDQLREMCR